MLPCHSLRGECGLKFLKADGSVLKAWSLSARRVWIEISSVRNITTVRPPNCAKKGRSLPVRTGRRPLIPRIYLQPGTVSCFCIHCGKNVRKNTVIILYGNFMAKEAADVCRTQSARQTHPSRLTAAHQSKMISAINTRSTSPVFTSPCP